MFKKQKTELLSETDRKFVLGASLTLAFLFLLLYFNYQDFSSDGQQKQIGTLTVKKNLVQRKPEGKVVWKSVLQTYPVYERDTVRTGEASQAVLHLHGKFKIDMDENTLILLDFLDSDKKGRVRLGNGSARFRQADPEKGKTFNLEIVDKGQNINLSGAKELLLNKSSSGKKLEVAALKDKVKITSDSGIEETLTPDSLLVLSDKKASKQRLAVIPQKPEDGAYIAGAGQSIAVNFRWKTGAKAQKIQIDVSKRSDLSSPVLSKKVAKSSFAARLQPGLYYWRLTGSPSKEFPGKYSVIRKFRVISQAAVKTYKPLPNSIFTYRDIEPFVSFSWSSGSEGSTYLLEIAKDKKFKKLLVQKNTFSINYGSTFPQGKYYWRVINKNDLAASQISSQSKSFKIVRRKEMKLSLRLNLAPKQVLDRKSLEKKGFVLNWKDNPEVALTEVVVAEDPKLSETVIEEKVSGNFFRMKAKFSKAVYYYKLKSYNEQGELLSTSPVRSFKVQNVKLKLGSFRPLSPRGNSSFHKRLAVQNGIRFAWQKLSKNAKFRLLVADNRNFKRPL